MPARRQACNWMQVRRCSRRRWAGSALSQVPRADFELASGRALQEEAAQGHLDAGLQGTCACTCAWPAGAGCAAASRPCSAEGWQAGHALQDATPNSQRVEMRQGRFAITPQAALLSPAICTAGLQRCRSTAYASTAALQRIACPPLLQSRERLAWEGEPPDSRHHSDAGRLSLLHHRLQILP